MNPVHRNRGWHATATVGAIGAAAACARLLGLDVKRAAHAVSLATSMAAGFMAQFGTMAKPLHAGLAAKSGVLAASLARSGLEAGLDTLDGPTGMNRLMVGPDYEALRDALTHVEHGQNLRFETGRVGDPLLILSSGLKAKRFPNCGSAHRAMDGLLALRDAHGFAAGEIEAIRVRAPVSHLNNLMYAAPEDALQAKFSLEYALACIAVTGRCTLADFTARAAVRAELRALYPRIHRHPVDKAEGEFPTEVEVALKDGRRFGIAVAWPAGSLAAPFTAAQLWAKFEGCTAGLLSEDRAAALRAALAGLPALPSVAPAHGAALRSAAMTDARYTALVLAASRGNLDPLAKAGGVSHKCFIDIAGRPMLSRVVEAVTASPRVGRIIVAIEPGSMAEAKQRSSPRCPAPGRSITCRRARRSAPASPRSPARTCSRSSSPPATTRFTPRRW